MDIRDLQLDWEINHRLKDFELHFSIDRNLKDVEKIYYNHVRHHMVLGGFMQSNTMTETF